MADALFSARWHRVAHLRPQLRAQVQLRRQTQRGTDWFLLVDPSADEMRRINRSAYEFVGRFDGLCSRPCKTPLTRMNSGFAPVPLGIRSPENRHIRF